MSELCHSLGLAALNHLAAEERWVGPPGRSLSIMEYIKGIPLHLWATSESRTATEIRELAVKLAKEIDRLQLRSLTVIAKLPTLSGQAITNPILWTWITPFNTAVVVLFAKHTSEMHDVLGPTGYKTIRVNFSVTFSIIHSNLDFDTRLPPNRAP